MCSARLAIFSFTEKEDVAPWHTSNVPMERCMSIGTVIVGENHAAAFRTIAPSTINVRSLIRNIICSFLLLSM